jgi:hypothetical protein
LAVFVSICGVGLMLAAAGASGAEPILANYVPLIDHWLFGAGLTAFGAGVLLSLLDRRLLPAETAGPSFIVLPDAVLPGLRATGIAVLLAALTFANAWIAQPAGLDAHTLYELLLWGGGHVLQLASSAAMLSVWLLLVAQLTGRSPLSRNASAALFGILVLPWSIAPLLPVIGLQNAEAREIFTDLMRWGIFPSASIVLFACVRELVRAARAGSLGRAQMWDVRFVGFTVSAGLAVLGYVLGALIRGSNTMVPAHYHAAIGAVTACFMTATYPLLASLGIASDWHRLAVRLRTLQPALFGVGQAIFALGFAFAGAHGAGRKVYASDQHVKSLAESIGLVVMGAGGMLAIAGGVLYLTLVAVAWRRNTRSATSAWTLRAAATGGTHG